MCRLPRAVSEAWDDRKGPAVLGTVNIEGTPNLVCVSCVWRLNEEQFLIADNCFHKTRANMMANSSASPLFITARMSAYQIKGRIDYRTSGDIYKLMKCRNAQKGPGRPGAGAAVLKLEEVHNWDTRNRPRRSHPPLALLAVVRYVLGMLLAF